MEQRPFGSIGEIIPTVEIPRMVLTGGPCAGKTTALTFLTQKLEEFGFTPMVVPEAPTLLMSSGISPRVVSEREFQTRVVSTMLLLEREVEYAARSIAGHAKPVILCDRGIMDTLAYMEPKLFRKIVARHGVQCDTKCDDRYHAVFHLRSAAIGAEEFYTTANNPNRRENVTEARVKDEATLNAWIGHPHVVICDNEGKSFDQKLHYLLRRMCHALGIPEPLEIERKFLVSPVSPIELSLPYETIEIEQQYIVSPDPNVELRIRRRSKNGKCTYFETKKRAVRPGVRVETERFIAEDEYVFGSRYRLPGTSVVKKRRTCFVDRNQYFELDEIITPERYRGVHLLEIELAHENDPIDLPRGIQVIADVTDEIAFANRRLSEG